MSRKTYIWENGELVEKIKLRKSDHHYVQDDIKPYQSMINGQMITSRSQHRRHLKANGCIEVGNEKMENKPRTFKSNRREILREQLAGMTHKEANRILDRIRDEIRFSNPHRK
jgi:hypothetical protein